MIRIFLFVLLFYFTIHFATSLKWNCRTKHTILKITDVAVALLLVGVVGVMPSPAYAENNVTPTLTISTTKTVEIIPRWNVYARVARLESIIFTKEEAKAMEASLKEEANEREARMKEEAKALEARMVSRMDATDLRTNVMFGITTSLTAFSTFKKK
mmetsp:Transcript_14218/g.21168  ORF Transcript_14218/g.21168 Transcript_14218/m.21168 type:complete len:157 (-) Transcript_14218:115-585(-)